MNWDWIQDSLVICLNGSAMLAMGLALPVSQVMETLNNRIPLLLGLLVNLLVAPLLALALSHSMSFAAPAALGLMLCAAAPGGNTGPLLSSNARGSIAYSVTLVIILSFASLVTLPVYLELAGSAEQLSIPVGRILILILSFHIAPLLAGMLVHHYWPATGQRFSRYFRFLANVALLALTILLLALRWQALVANGWIPLIAMLLFVLAMLALGLVVLPSRAYARSLSMTTATRNLSLALLLGSQVFKDPQTMMTVLAYGLVWVSITVPLSFYLGKDGATST